MKLLLFVFISVPAFLAAGKQCDGSGFIDVLQASTQIQLKVVVFLVISEGLKLKLTSNRRTNASASN